MGLLWIKPAVDESVNEASKKSVTSIANALAKITAKMKEHAGYYVKAKAKGNAKEMKQHIEHLKTLTKQKKPVRFTWKGAADLFATMSNTPLRNVNLRSLMDKSLPRVTDLAEGRDKPKEKDYIDFFEDMEKSIFGAAQNLGYSIGDL